MKHGKWHLNCCLKPMGGKVLWLLSLLALFMAWAASASPTGVFLKLPVAHLFWDSLTLGVLAIGLSSGGCRSHMSCGMDSKEEDSE